MKKFSLKQGLNKIQLVTLRFPFTMFFLLCLAFLLFLQINKHDVHIQQRLWAFFALGVGLSVVLSLFLEELENRFMRSGLHLIGIILLMFYCYLLPEKFMPVQFYQLIAIGISFILTAFFISFLQKNKEISFWQFSKTTIIQLIISYIFASVLMIGLSLAILSLNELFKINVQHEVYQNLSIVCFVLFAPVYFLANVPDKVEKNTTTYTFDKFLKILGLYILLPILAIYSLILYVYLIQIIVKWELPNGWVSTLVSVLGLGGFLTMLILYPMRLENENKVLKLFSSYFSILLIPLLILMSVGIFRRLGDYGITINRLYVLILNVWLFGISIYLLITKGNYLKWIVISFTSILFLSSVGPWSVFRITKRTMVTEIGQMLNDAKLLKNGKVIENPASVKINKKLKENLAGKISYTSKTFGNYTLQKYFPTSISDMNSWKINRSLGLNLKSEEEKYFNASIDNNNQLIDIDTYKNYSELELFNGGKDTLFNSNEIRVVFKKNDFLIFKKNVYKPFISISLNDKLETFLSEKQSNKSYSSDYMTLKGDNYKLVIYNIAGNYNSMNDSIVLTNIHANLFLK